LRLAHLTTVDMSLALLLATELAMDVHWGFETFGISAAGPYADEMRGFGVTHLPVPSLTRAWNPRSDVRAGRELAATLRDLRPDILHTHNPKTGVLGRVLGRAARIPVVVNTCHGLWASTEDGLLRRGLVLGAEGLAAQFSHAELYQNDEDRAALRPVVRRSRGRLVGNGVDLRKFKPDAKARLRVRAELGVVPDEILVGGVGRLVVEKGLREFAEVARRLAGRAVFVWAGPEDADKPGAVAEALAGVRLLGSRSDMPALYSAFDIFALPSYREGFSRSAMEAAACGTAMVLSDIRGCREVGQDGRHLLLVPPGDATRLADAIARLVEDARLRRTLGIAARERAMIEFDQRAVARASLETYLDVARRRGLGWCVKGAAP
jgi:glycosyltransferase involved in cell wall biosynthesis